MHYHHTYTVITFLAFLFMPWSLLGRLFTSFIGSLAEVPHFVSWLAFHLTRWAIGFTLALLLGALIMWALAALSVLVINIGWF